MEFFCPIAGFVGLVAAFSFVVWFASRNAAKAEYEAAQKAYREHLERLKQEPANHELRDKALALGRHFAARAEHCFLNGIGGVERFDEAALGNDIAAACARSAASSEASNAKPTLEERLAKLDELRSKNLITDQEHQSRRAQILQEL